MRNNHFFKTQILMAAIAAAVIAPFCAFSQQRTAARTTTTIKDSDIYVPDKVLEPSYTRKEASDMLKEYIAAFGDSDMPNSYDVFAKDPDKYKRIGTRQLQSAMGNLYNYVHDPEIQEVTGVTDGWLKSLYNKALELKEPAEKMDKAIRTKNAALYTQATKGYAEKYDELQKFVRKTPERLSAEALKKIVDANKAKRKADYIALRKKQILEQEAAANKAIEEEIKKASGSNKKN